MPHHKRQHNSAGLSSWACCLNRSLLERMLQARLVYQRANMARAISFEYLNRQLVWHELSELLLFVLPLISVTRLKRMIVSQWPSLRATTGKTLSGVLFSHANMSVFPDTSGDLTEQAPARRICYY